MRAISELRDRHKGQDVYVIGSAASLGFMDREFFRGRITIGVNRVCTHIPTVYTVMKDPGPWVAEASATGTTLICSEFAFGNPDEGKNDLGPDAYVFRSATSADPLLSRDDMLFPGSTAGAAMHVAAEMGAANIILCGVDGGTLDGEFAFPGYNSVEHARYFSWGFLGRNTEILRQVRTLLQTAYGCRVFSLSPFVGLTTDGHKFRSADAVPCCRFCGSTEMVLRGDDIGGHSRFYECDSCNCVTSSLEYRDVTFFYQQEDYAGHHRVPREDLLRAVSHNFNLISRTSVPVKTCLDVGCLEGALMELLANAGWEVQGWDIDVAGRPPGTIIGTDFRAAAQYGLVVSREVIEHVENPRRHFRELAAAVMPGGLLHLQCPRPHSDLSDGVAFQTTHLTLLDPSAVRQMIREAGMRVEHCELWSNGQCWQVRKPL